jgi:hypothetical protein
MTRTAIKATLLGAFALVSAGAGSAAAAQPLQMQTPKGWSYEIQNGRRVPKPSNRVANPDGSWREETRQGNCVTVREKSSAGEYKETRQCNPGQPG